jgi:hypothetical protein
MRLTEDQVRQGLLHADKEVRSACLRYFSDGHSRNETVMPVAIEALERFGRNEAFHHVSSLAELAQTEDTIRWALNELQTRRPGTEKEMRYLDALSRLFCHVDPQALLPLEKTILSAPGFDREYADTLTQRLKLLSWDDEALWRELEAICAEALGKEYVSETRYHEGEPIVERLARDGDRHAGQMMALLQTRIDDYENDPLTWLVPLMVRMAGEMRHAPAIPSIVAWQHEDHELLSEECQTALAKIGTDGVVQALWDAYPTAEWHFHLYAIEPLGRVHTDLAVAACTALIDKEEDPELREWLAMSLVGHFSSEGNALALKMIRDDLGLDGLKDALVPACLLMGQDVPELEQWRKDLAKVEQRRLALENRPPPPPKRQPLPRRRRPCSSPFAARGPSVATIPVLAAAARSSRSAASTNRARSENDP